MDDLSDKRENENEKTGNLLDPQERLILEQIATGGPPHSQRAQSLLTIDAGVTQKTAALQSGQTVGQVSYWLGKFRREGMSIFPKELLHQVEPEPPLEKKEVTKKKLKKGKDSKKAKKMKKSKKVKSSKKAKKDKKNGKKKQGKKSRKRKKKSKKK